MVRTQKTAIGKKTKPHQGAALLMCLFTLFIVSSFLINMFSTEMLQLASTRNLIEYEQALYQANAGIHHACAELIQDNAYRTAINNGTLPPSTSPIGYSVTLTDLSAGNVLIRSTGYTGQGNRTVEATIEL